MVGWGFQGGREMHALQLRGTEREDFYYFTELLTYFLFEGPMNICLCSFSYKIEHSNNSAISFRFLDLISMHMWQWFVVEGRRGSSHAPHQAIIQHQQGV